MAIHIPNSSLPRVVVIGGGFGGTRLCRDLDTEKYQLVLIDRFNFHTFQPLLYQVATAGLEPSSIAGPLRKLFEKKRNFYFRMGEVKKICPELNAIETSLGVINYDFLVIANGTKTSFFGHDENYKEVFPLKQLPHALSLRNSILRNLEDALLVKELAEISALMNVVIVGGGPTGVELAGALSELKKHVLPKDYPELDFTQMEIFLIEGLDRLLGGMSEKSSVEALQALKKMGVHIHLKKRVVSYDGEKVMLADGSSIACKTFIWAAGVTGNVISGLLENIITKANRIKVNDFNQVEGTENIFAIGDLAFMHSEEFPNGHPQLAPVAIQQGKLLAKNLNNWQSGKRKTFRYKDKGSMATIGRNNAVADLPNNIHFNGFIGWFIWIIVHLISLIGFRNKLIVLINWMWNYITYDRSIRLILKAVK